MKEEHLEKYKLELKNLALHPNKAFKKIKCPSCNNSVAADNININDKIAKCNTCDVIFPIQEEILDLVKIKTIKQEVLRPEGIDIFYYKNDLDITLEQPKGVLDGLLLFPLFILPVLLGNFAQGYISFFWPVAFLMLGIAAIINLRTKQKIYISIDDHKLSMKWRPKKFFKDKQYDVNEIDQIYIKKSNEGAVSVMMIVNGIEGQKHIQLISGLVSMSKARYLEQEIEHYLGIEDRAIPEEAT